MTKLAPALPKGDGNGLTAIARDLIDNPHNAHVVIAIIDCKQITTDNDSGEVVPTARIRRVEPVNRGDLTLAHDLMRRALEKRTGQTVLPFEVENELREAFGNVDFDTGEISGDQP